MRGAARYFAIPSLVSNGTPDGRDRRTAFHVRRGRITDWLRVPDEEPEPMPATRS